MNMSGVEKFSEIVGLDLESAICEATHNALMKKQLPHASPHYSKHDRIELVDELMRRLETVKMRINLEVQKCTSI